MFSLQEQRRKLRVRDGKESRANIFANLTLDTRAPFRQRRGGMGRDRRGRLCVVTSRTANPGARSRVPANVLGNHPRRPRPRQGWITCEAAALHDVPSRPVGGALAPSSLPDCFHPPRFPVSALDLIQAAHAFLVKSLHGLLSNFLSLKKLLESYVNLSTVNLFSPLPWSKKSQIGTNKNKTKQTPKSPPKPQIRLFLDVHGVRAVGSTVSAGRWGAPFYMFPRSSSAVRPPGRPLGRAPAPWGREPCSRFFPLCSY